ncbi:MAG: preprotein translocase subunit SecY [Candidatus Altiarchaeota archaeon]|nr:preprotein translocase subunit SecY [Candidatus Altiarchaeota archaeon]
MASVLYKLEPLYRHFPEIKGPSRHVSFKEKLFWTGLVLILFFIMGLIPPLGASTEQASQMQLIQIIFASQMGTLMSIGIGPIVTASIILQLLVGSKMINLDLSKTEDRAVFQGTQKLLVIAVALFEAFAFVKVGAIPLVGPGFDIVLFVTLQIAFASVVLMFLDEIVSKWGIGSGIGIFIAGGVAQTIVTQAFNINYLLGTTTVKGIIPQFVDTLMAGQLDLIPLWPVFMTVVIFLAVAYFESLKIEIPLSYGRFGIGARYPLKFFYTSNIPVILASAVLANVTIFAMIFAGLGAPILGQVSENQIIPNIEQGGIGFLITPGSGDRSIHGILGPGDIQKLTDWQNIVHIITYTVVFLSLCILFGVFWVMMTNMDPETVSKQMEQSGLQIPGFRADRRVIKRVLDRYIPQLTVVSAVAVGLLAVVADLTGALGTGTGILLTVGILYRMYEEIKREQMQELSPAIRKLMGKDRV